MVKWSDEDKLRALAIVEASSAGEASKKTGIPRGTILAWMRNNQSTSITQSEQSIILPKKVREVAEKAIEQAKEEVKEYVQDQIKVVADKLMSMNQLAIDAIEQTIKEGPKEDESNAQWLRSLVGVIAQGVEKHQLLDGKPTQRSEVTADVVNEKQYHIIQQVLREDEELADRIIERVKFNQ